jgi:hypothetical protein
MISKIFYLLIATSRYWQGTYLLILGKKKLNFKKDRYCCFLSGDHKQKYYWGHKEILIPVYKKMEDAVKKHPAASVLVSFASLRSAYESTLEAMHFDQVRNLNLWV